MKLRELNIALDFRRQMAESGSKLAYAAQVDNDEFTDLLNKKDGFNKLLRKKQVELALVGKTGQLIYEEGDKKELAFTPASMILLDSYIDTLNEVEVDFEFFMVKFSDLTEKEKSRLCSSELKPAPGVHIEGTAPKTEKVFSETCDLITGKQWEVLSNFILELPALKQR